MINGQETLAFLQKLISEPAYQYVSDEELLLQLKDVITNDNFCSAEISEPHYLRGLAESEKVTSGPEFIESLILVATCIICAGLASGLTQGLLSLDHMEMEIKSRSGTALEKQYAAKLLPIITQHHWLLVTLMLWNASATEALPIFLNRLVPEFVAIIISVTMVLFVGEIIPASILTGPKQLQIAATLTPLVYLVLIAFFPIAYPISLVLDYVIGDESGVTIYNKTELATMLALQQEEGDKLGRMSAIRTVDRDDVALVGGALKFREMPVRDVMTPLEVVYMIPLFESLSYKTLYEIFKKGYSRIPIYDKDKNDIVGIILAKDLIFVDPEDETPIRNFMQMFGRKPAVVWHDQNLGDTLRMFCEERAHMAIVRDVQYSGNDDPLYKVVGIITLEDIIEEIIGVEIMDETDQDHFDRTDAPVDYRDMDFARLKLLHNKISDEHLSPDEVNAVTAHLMANVPQIKSAFGTNAQAVQDLVRSSKVLNMKRLTSEVCRAGTKPQTEDMIYRRGKMSNAATLILNGRIGVQAGNEGFYSELGAWSCIAADAILEQEGTYIPDFTAFVISDTVRFLQITVNNPLLSTDDSNPQTTLDQDATATRVRLMKKTNSRKFKQAENRSALTTPSPRAKAMSLPDISESQKSYASTKNPLHPSTSGKSEKYDAESKGTSRNLLNPDLIKAESPRGKSPMRTEESARSDLSDLHRQDFSTGDSDEPYSPYQELGTSQF